MIKGLKQETWQGKKCKGKRRGEDPFPGVNSQPIESGIAAGRGELLRECRSGHHWSGDVGRFVNHKSLNVIKIGICGCKLLDAEAAGDGEVQGIICE